MICWKLIGTRVKYSEETDRLDEDPARIFPVLPDGTPNFLPVAEMSAFLIATSCVCFLQLVRHLPSGSGGLRTRPKILGVGTSVG